MLLLKEYKYQITRIYSRAIFPHFITLLALFLSYVPKQEQNFHNRILALSSKRILYASRAQTTKKAIKLYFKGNKALIIKCIMWAKLIGRQSFKVSIIRFIILVICVKLLKIIKLAPPILESVLFALYIQLMRVVANICLSCIELRLPFMFLEQVSNYFKNNLLPHAFLVILIIAYITAITDTANSEDYLKQFWGEFFLKAKNCCSNFAHSEHPTK